MESDDSMDSFAGFSDVENDLQAGNGGNIDEDLMSEVSSVHTSDLSGSDFSEVSDFDESSGDETEDNNDENLQEDELVWSNNLHDVQLNEFTEEVGPATGLEWDDAPVNYFYEMFEEQMFRDIAAETNRYARYKQQVRACARWTDTTTEEIKAFFGIHILMGIHSLPAYKHYWSEDDFLKVDSVANIMPKARYEKLSEYLHIVDDVNNAVRGQVGHDPISKIRPIFDMNKRNFREKYLPHKQLSVDEAMIGFKGRLYFKQYLPAKPTKWGIKVWMLADATNGYILNMNVYTGRDVNNPLPEQGLGYSVVENLTTDWQNKNHEVYMDNFFSSVHLFEHLETVGTYACATIRANRRGLPNEIRNSNIRRPGDCVKMQKGNMLAVAWMDKRKVHVLSTCQNPGDVQVRRNRGHVVNVIDKPEAIINYNKYMGGVDKADQLRSYYSCGRESKKWWKYLLWFIIDISIVNAYIIYSETLPGPTVDDVNDKKEFDTHLAFRLQVARSLIAGYSNRQRKGRKRRREVANIVVGVANIGAHTLVKVKGRKKVCVQCSASGRKTPAGRGVETSYKCGVCNVPLCQKRGCFAEFHAAHGV